MACLVAREHHMDHGVEIEADGFGVDEGGVALDDAALLQRLDPAPAGGRRHARALGKILVGDAAVGLQRLEDLPVCRLDFSFSCHAG